MPDRPRISVVMSSYQRPELLEVAIASVLAQTEQDWELVVIDDHSATDPAPLVAAFGDPRIRYLRQDAQRGIGRNVADGMLAARGEFVTNLHDDDVAEPDYLAVLHAALVEHPEAVLAFCDHLVIDSTGVVLTRESADRSAAEGRAALAPGVHQPFVREALVERTVFLGLGSMWRNGAVDWEDVVAAGDYWDNYTLYLLARDGGAAVYVKRPLGRWRMHTGSNTMASAGFTSPAAKLRTGTALVHCASTYATDPRLAEHRAAFRGQVAEGHATSAIAHLRLDEPAAARSSALRSLAVRPSARAGVALAAALLPARLRRRVASTRRPARDLATDM